MRPEIAEHIASAEADVRQDLVSIRRQARAWTGGHIFDGPDCLLCGAFGPIDGDDPCVVEKLGSVLCGAGVDLMRAGIADVIDDGQDYKGVVNLRLDRFASILKGQDSILLALGQLHADVSGRLTGMGYGPK